MNKGKIENVIGSTPLIYIQSLSQISGCHIWGKAEFLNPGGSVKDRTALGILRAAKNQGHLKDGMTVVEGTAGNTGIGLAVLCNQMGYSCHIVMPNNQADEKYQALLALNAQLTKVAPCPFSDQNHFYHTARRIYEGDSKKFFWANQFENLDNFKIHFQTTGPEIWEQTSGKIDYFCTAAGTGGTIAGVSQFLKSKSPTTQIVLIDPLGSGLFEYIQNGQMKSHGSSVTEGIGIMRLTENFKKAQIDKAVQVDDQKMISMLYHLAKKEGLLVGTSSALNLVGTYEQAMKEKNTGKTFVTVLCDSALRYQSKIFNPQWLKEKNLIPKNLDSM